MLRDWDGMGWDGISPDRSISRSPSGDNKVCQLQECFATCIEMVLIILNLQVVTGLLCLANCTFGCYAAFKEVFKLTWLVVLLSYVFLAVSREIQKLS